MRAFLEKARSELRHARIWQAATLGVVGLSALDHWHNAELMHRSLYIAMVNGGTHYVGEAIPEQQAIEYQNITAKDAAFCILNRSPEGYLNGSKIRFLFGPKAQKQLQDAFQATRDLYTSERMTTNFRPHLVTREVINDQDAKVAVDCDLDVTKWNSQVSTTPDVNSKRVRVVMYVRINEDWTQNNKYPLVVTGYQVQNL